MDGAIVTRGRFLDRARRGFVAYRWSSLFGVLATAAIVVGAVCSATVALGEEADAARARVAAVRAAQQAVGEEPAPVTKKQRGTVTLRGEFVNDAGKRVKVDGSLYYRVESGEEGETYSGWPVYDNADGGTFEHETPPGQTWLAFVAKGYCPSSVGPFNGNDGDVIDNIKIVLKRGFDQEVLVTDDKGEPLPKARVEATPMPFDFAASGNDNALRAKGDAEGRAQLKHLAENMPYQLTIRAKGFAPLTKKVERITADEVLKFALQRAKPASGVVVNAAGEPVRGATVRLGNSISPYPYILFEDEPLLATTDMKGRFVINQLTPNEPCDLKFFHAVFGGAVLTKVAEGEVDLQVTLARLLHIKGRVVGDLQLLENSEGKPVVQLVQIDDDSILGRGSELLPIDAEDGGQFEFNYLPPGGYTITAGGQVTTYQLMESIDDLVIKLEAKPAVVQADPPPQVDRVVQVTFFENGVPVQAEGSLAYSEVPVEGAQEPLIAAKKVAKATVPLKEGTASFVVKAPGQLKFGKANVPGFLVPHIDTIDVTAGNDPLKVTVPLMPVGAVRVKVLEADGTPATTKDVSGSANYTIMEGEAMHFAYQHGTTNGSGEMVLSPIPLGFDCLITASRGDVEAVRKTVRLTADQPVVSVELRLPRAIEVEVLLQDDKGRALADIPVSLNYSDAEYSRFSLFDDDKTDKQGRTKWQVGAEGGEYSVSTSPDANWQPAETVLNRDGKPTILTLKPGLIVEGVVLAADGKPIRGVTVSADLLEEGNIQFVIQEAAERPTDARGRFRFSNLVNAKYRISVGDFANEDENYIPLESVQAGDKTPVIVQRKD